MVGSPQGTDTEEDPAPSAGRTLRDLQREQTHQRILTAALDDFTAMGVGTVTIDQIARAAGISRATLYLHFPNKEAILLALLRRDLKAVRGIYDSLPEAARKGGAAIVRWMEGYVDTLRRHRADLRLFSLAAASDAEVRDLVRDHHMAITAKLLGPDRASGEQADRPLATRTLIMLDRIDRVAGALSQDDPDLHSSTVMDVVASEVIDVFERIGARP